MFRTSGARPPATNQPQIDTGGILSVSSGFVSTEGGEHGTIHLHLTRQHSDQRPRATASAPIDLPLRQWAALCTARPVHFPPPAGTRIRSRPAALPCCNSFLTNSSPFLF